MYYLSDICSLCLVNNQNMKSILSKDSDNIVIEEKLKTLGLEPIHFKPHIPKYICDNCLKNLNFSRTFKLSCIENIATLNTYVEKLEVHGPYTNLSITLLTHRKYNKEEALELENQNYSNTCKNQIQTNCPQDNNVVQNEFIKEEIEETDFLYDENIIIMAENRQINSDDIKAEIKEDIKITFEDTVLEEKLTNVLNNKQGPYEDFTQFNEEKHIIEKSENLTSNNVEELLNKTSEHIVNPLVSTNVEYEDCVDPELFEDNAADDEFLPSHSSSSAASDAADGDLDTVETPASHKVIKSKGTNSNETAMFFNKYLYNHTLSRHERIHNYIRPHKCSVCNKEFSQRGKLTIHERTHTGEKPYKCNVCNTAFVRRDYLTTHERIHSGKKPYKCNVCNKAFAHRGNFTRHERIHSGEKPYKCNVCNMAFAGSSDLTDHERFHTGKKPYKCNVCNKAFSQRSSLTTHKHIHNNDRPYKCSVCSKAFRHSSHLTTHMRMHTGNKPYKCNVCNVGFSQHSHLKTHERIHNNDRRYKCNVCNRAFIQRSNLTTHERIHSGNKPYKCNVCNKAFNQHSPLKMHECIHNNDQRYKCSVCNAEFTQKFNLTTHMQLHKIQAKA